MKEMMNRFSILTIALLLAGVLTACHSATENSIGGTTRAKVSNDKKIVNDSSSSNAAESNKTDKKVSAQCALTKAPEIKGFTLGQTVEEIDNRIPGFKKVYEKEKQEGNKYEKKDPNFTMVSSVTSFSANNPFEGAEFKDFQFTWHFMNEKLESIFVTYGNEEFDSRKAFKEKVIKELDLPKDGWRKESDSEEDISHRLECQNFLVNISVDPKLGAIVQISNLTNDKK